MKSLKLMLSAVAVVAVVGASLAFKPVSEDVVYCATSTPRTQPGTNLQFCNIAVPFHIISAGTGSFSARCLPNSQDAPCQLTSVLQTAD